MPPVVQTVRRRGRLLAGSAADAGRAELLRQREAAEPPPTLEEFLTSPEWVGPYMGEVTPSPLIKAICQAADGRPVTVLEEGTAQEAFRLGLDALRTLPRPNVVVVEAGRRGGKTSNLLAPAAVHRAMFTPAPTLKPGEIARVLIVSPDTDISTATFNYCQGIVANSPRLFRAVVRSTTEEIVLRRPDGKLVEIVVGAASRGGTVARSRTLLFVGLDEASFFYSADGHSVNDEEIFRAATGSLRFAPGAQLWMVSTPWIEGQGKMQELIDAHWGVPGDVLVAARVSSYTLRGIPDDGSLREETDDEDTYRREILAIPLPLGARGFFPAMQLAAALARTPPSTAPDQLGGGGDFAFERDAAAVATVARWLGGLFAPTMVEERRATPDDDVAATATVRELGAALAGAGVHSCMADHWRKGFVREHLSAEGVSLIDAPGGPEGKMTTYGALKRVIAEERLALGALPKRMAEYVRDQLRGVVALPLAGGGFKLTSPRTKKTSDGGSGPAGARTGSHGDVVSALVLAAWMAGSGQTAQAWGRVRAPAARATGRAGRGLSGMDYLRSRSAGVGLGRGGERRRDDDD